FPREQLFLAWERFKKYILRAPNHGFSDHIFIEKFYTGLDALTQSVANTTTDGCYMDRTFNKIAIILDIIAKHNHSWRGGDQSGGINTSTMLATHPVAMDRNISKVTLILHIKGNENLNRKNRGSSSYVPPIGPLFNSQNWMKGLSHYHGGSKIEGIVEK
ncbi:hypothetical protein HAX54_038289, partial [Datura stramonium]|nr:hypothetical protein [Datura stramonium]